MEKFLSKEILSSGNSLIDFSPTQIKTTSASIQKDGLLNVMWGHYFIIIPSQLLGKIPSGHRLTLTTLRPFCLLHKLNGNQITKSHALNQHSQPKCKHLAFILAQINNAK